MVFVVTVVKTKGNPSQAQWTSTYALWYRADISLPLTAINEYTTSTPTSHLIFALLYTSLYTEIMSPNCYTDSFITLHIVMYSVLCLHIFTGNTDQDTLVTNSLLPPVMAKKVRLYPTNASPALRWELEGNRPGN